MYSRRGHISLRISMQKAKEKKMSNRNLTYNPVYARRTENKTKYH